MGAAAAARGGVGVTAVLVLAVAGTAAAEGASVDGDIAVRNTDAERAAAYAGVVEYLAAIGGGVSTSVGMAGGVLRTTTPVRVGDTLGAIPWGAVLGAEALATDADVCEAAGDVDDPALLSLAAAVLKAMRAKGRGDGHRLHDLHLDTFKRGVPGYYTPVFRDSKEARCLPYAAIQMLRRRTAYLDEFMALGRAASAAHADHAWALAVARGVPLQHPTTRRHAAVLVPAFDLAANGGFNTHVFEATADGIVVKAAVTMPAGAPLVYRYATAAERGDPLLMLFRRGVWRPHPPHPRDARGAPLFLQYARTQMQLRRDDPWATHTAGRAAAACAAAPAFAEADGSVAHEVLECLARGLGGLGDADHPSTRRRAGLSLLAAYITTLLDDTGVGSRSCNTELLQRSPGVGREILKMREDLHAAYAGVRRWAADTMQRDSAAVAAHYDLPRDVHPGVAAKMTRLRAYVEGLGGRVSPKLETYTDATKGNGLRTIAGYGFHEGEEIAYIPNAGMVVVPAPEADGGRSNRHSHSTSVDNAHHLETARRLLAAKTAARNDADPARAWFDLYPRVYPPLTDVQWLEGRAHRCTLPSSRMYMKAHAENVAQLVAEGASLAAAADAMGAASSRSTMVNGSTALMIPVFDMLNHAHPRNVRVVCHANGAVVIAMRPVPPRTELTYSYGVDGDPSVFLMTYGFANPDATVVPLYRPLVHIPESMRGACDDAKSVNHVRVSDGAYPEALVSCVAAQLAFKDGRAWDAMPPAERTAYLHTHEAALLENLHTYINRLLSHVPDPDSDACAGDDFFTTQLRAVALLHQTTYAKALRQIERELAALRAS